MQQKEVGLFAPYPWAVPKRSILNRVKACNFIKSLQRSCFTVNIPKFLRTSILKNISERLLLNGVWKCCWKYTCEWIKKDLAAQEVPFKFLRTFINILWNFRFMQYCYFLDLLKVCLILSIQSCICNITVQRISPVKSKHKRQRK